jgi:uncharacterized protein (TIGR00725 family)
VNASTRGTPYVAVIGPNSARASDLDRAEQVGALLAARGAIVVCGGRGGIMEAVCKGAAQSGGQTIGLLPGNERAEGNSYLTIALPTGLGELRNGLIVRAADAVIAIGGSWGTLNEIALAVHTGKRVIELGGWRIQPNEQSAAGIAPAQPIPAESPVQAVDLALA